MSENDSPVIRRTRLRNVVLTVALLLIAVLVALAVLRSQANAAASDYGDDMRAHVEQFDQVYEDDERLDRAIKRVSAIGATFTDESGNLDKVSRLAPRAAEYMAAARVPLEREARERPELRSVPLGAALSDEYADTQRKQERVSRFYSDALQLTREGEQLYPKLEAGYRTFLSFAIFGSVFQATEGALSILRRDSAKSLAQAIRGIQDDISDRLKRLRSDRASIARVTTPGRYEARKQAVLKTIDGQIGHAEELRKLIAADEIRGEAWERTAKAYDADEVTDYVEPYLYLYGDMANTQQRSAQLSAEFREYVNKL